MQKIVTYRITFFIIYGLSNTSYFFFCKIKVIFTFRIFPHDPSFWGIQQDWEVFVFYKRENTVSVALYSSFDQNKTLWILARSSSADQDQTGFFQSWWLFFNAIVSIMNTPTAFTKVCLLYTSVMGTLNRTPQLYRKLEVDPETDCWITWGWFETYERGGMETDV